MSQVVSSQQLVSSLAVGELSSVTTPGKFNIFSKGDSFVKQQLGSFSMGNYIYVTNVYIELKIIYYLYYNIIKTLYDKRESCIYLC